MIARVKNRQYEAMTFLLVGDYQVRVWSTVPHFMMGPDPRVLGPFLDFDVWRGTDPVRIAQELDKIDGVAGFEILDHARHGAIVYPDWH